MPFATGKPPFDDKRLRQVISKGIDRPEIVDVLFFGYGEVGSDFFTSFHWAHDPSITVPYDPEGAKALLKEAGYDESNPFKFTLLSRPEPLFLDQAVLIQDQLKRIGVDVEILPMEVTALSAITQEPHSEWPGDAFVFRICPMRGTAFEYTYYQYGEKGGLNRCGYNEPGGYQNPDFAALLDKALTYSDYDPAQREEAKPLYRELSLMWIEDAPGLILNWWAQGDIMYPYVKGWVFTPIADIGQWKQIWLDK
jgi:peptide/nickel transport system substrate-binding protein